MGPQGVRGSNPRLSKLIVAFYVLLLHLLPLGTSIQTQKKPLKALKPHYPILTSDFPRGSCPLCYFNRHVCPSMRSLVCMYVSHKIFFSLKSPWNHPLTPGVPHAHSPSGGARMCPRSRHCLVHCISKTI